jgi:N-acetyl-anhydromuramyl-L-alanine amidase AmpD
MLLIAPVFALLAAQPLREINHTYDAATFKAPGFNRYLWVDSPNQNDRPADTLVDTIVLHHTAGKALQGTVAWFARTEAQASAHYTVGRDGSVIQHVSTFKRAWHAGKSIDRYGRENVNNFSVGIEIDNVGDGKEPYPQPQVDAVKHLVRSLMRYRFKNVKQITSHEFVAIPLGRKNDPSRNFPWSQFEDTAKEFNVELVYDIGPIKNDPKRQRQPS